MKVYIDKDELWPFYSISEADPDSWSTVHEIPDELWNRYCEAGRAYWSTKAEILHIAGIQDK